MFHNRDLLLNFDSSSSSKYTVLRRLRKNAHHTVTHLLSVHFYEADGSQTSKARTRSSRAVCRWRVPINQYVGMFTPSACITILATHHNYTDNDCDDFWLRVCDSRTSSCAGRSVRYTGCPPPKKKSAYYGTPYNFIKCCKLFSLSESGENL